MCAMHSHVMITHYNQTSKQQSCERKKMWFCVKYLPSSTSCSWLIYYQPPSSSILYEYESSSSISPALRFPRDHKGETTPINNTDHTAWYKKRGWLYRVVNTFSLPATQLLQTAKLSRACQAWFLCHG